ncbi:MAG: Peptidyl-prolyl cis-trans isomerase cyp10 [Watsoniomyces obsoletus]|nr:MAG: Peptidyl-prolyl cis-trans isomerase cyp10 [Watsoniomyces obsoletus]
MSQFTKVAFDQDAEISEAQRRKACGGCGTIYVPGWTSSVSVEREGLPNKKRKRNITAQPKTSSGGSAGVLPSEQAVRETNVVSTCWVCGRKLRQALHSRTTRKPEEGDSTSGSSALAEPKLQSRPSLPAKASLIGTAKPTPANSSSRKRAKSGKQQSLQSILSNQQPAKPNNPSAPSGLNLMDFLQTQ